MEAKAKYASSINSYLSIKDKAIAKKIEIAKLLTEICNHNGDVKSALNDADVKNFSFDFQKIRDIVNQTEEENKGKKKEVIQLKKE
jgi:hypothetical protein